MRKLVAALALLLAAACGKPFQASVDAKEICVTKLDQLISVAAVQSRAAAPASVAQTITIDGADLDDLEKNEIVAKLPLRSFQLTTAPGQLAGIERLVVVLASPGSDAGITLVNYDRHAPGAQDGLVQLHGDRLTGDLAPLGADLLGFVRSGAAQLRIEASGTLPNGALSSVEVCASAHATYDYGQKIGL